MTTWDSRWPILWLALTLASAVVFQGAARADGELRQELSEAAHTIANQLHQHGEDAIALGQFTEWMMMPLTLRCFTRSKVFGSTEVCE